MALRRRSGSGVAKRLPLSRTVHPCPALVLIMGLPRVLTMAKQMVLSGTRMPMVFRLGEHDPGNELVASRTKV